MSPQIAQCSCPAGFKRWEDSRLVVSGWPQQPPQGTLAFAEEFTSCALEIQATAASSPSATSSSLQWEQPNFWALRACHVDHWAEMRTRCWSVLRVLCSAGNSLACIDVAKKKRETTMEKTSRHSQSRKLVKRSSLVTTDISTILLLWLPFLLLGGKKVQETWKLFFPLFKTYKLSELSHWPTHKSGIWQIGEWSSSPVASKCLGHTVPGNSVPLFKIFIYL